MTIGSYKNRPPLCTLVLKHDPFVNFNLPQQVLASLEEVRRKSHRKLENEIIARVSCSFHHESHYLIMQPLAQFDFLPLEHETLDLKKMFKAAYAKKQFHEQLASIRAYFQKQEGFISITQQFPRELWHRMQIKAIERDCNIAEEMSLRLTATLQEPVLFGLPSLSRRKVRKQSKA